MRSVDILSHCCPTLSLVQIFSKPRTWARWSICCLHALISQFCKEISQQFHDFVALLIWYELTGRDYNHLTFFEKHFPTLAQFKFMVIDISRKRPAEKLYFLKIFFFSKVMKKLSQRDTPTWLDLNHFDEAQIQSRTDLTLVYTCAACNFLDLLAFDDSPGFAGYV